MEGFEFMKAVRKMRNDDIIIACMGPASGGKDSFIDLLFNQQLEEVERNDVDQIQVTRIKHPNPSYNDRIVLLNTPDFDTTTGGADIRITSMIRDWLKLSYTNDVSLTGLIYVHSIAETNTLDSLDQNLPLFGELCGWGKMSHVTLVSTMWDEVQPEVGIAREQELRSLFSLPVTDNGLSIRRLEKGTSEEAWKIVDNLISDRDERELILLQQKLNGFGIQLGKTEAGREIYRSFRQLVLDHGEHMQSLLVQIDSSDNPVELKKLRREYVGIKESFQNVLKEVKGMGIRPGKLIMNPFFEWRIRAKAIEINNYLDVTSQAPLTNYSCVSEFDGSILRSFSEAEQSEDVDQTSQISVILADVSENVATQCFITNLTGDDAQCMIDFLNHIVGLEDIKIWNRRQILFLMWKLAESANVFPKYHDDNDALCRSTQPLGDNSSLDDEWRASHTVKIDFQRVFNLLDADKAQERPYDEVKSPKRSRQATDSPTLSHSTDSPIGLSAFSAEPSFDRLSSVLTACAIQDFSLVPYPEGIRGPDLSLNAHVQNGKFRYDRDFLLQFMTICKAKPVALLPLDQLGIKPVHKTSLSKSRLHTQPTTIANEKHTSHTPHSNSSKSPKLPTVNTLRNPISSGERIADINYYLATGGHHSSARAGSADWSSPTEDTEFQAPELAESTTDNLPMQFMLRDVPELSGRKRVARNAVAAPSTIAQIHETAAKGKATQEEEYLQHQINMPYGSPKSRGNRREPSPANLEGWATAGNSKAARSPSKVNFSNFGKINKSPPVIFGPGSVFAGKKDKRESLSHFRAN